MHSEARGQRRGRDSRGAQSLATEYTLCTNPLRVNTAYTDTECTIVSAEHARAALREIAGWPGYTPTPLLALDGLPRALGHRLGSDCLRN